MRRFVLKYSHDVEKNCRVKSVNVSCVPIVDVQEQATDLAGRIRKLAKNERSGLLFVMDDSLSVLNAWFAEEMKLAATVIRRYFP